MYTHQDTVDNCHNRPLHILLQHLKGTAHCISDPGARALRLWGNAGTRRVNQHNKWDITLTSPTI